MDRPLRFYRVFLPGFIDRKLGHDSRYIPESYDSNGVLLHQRIPCKEIGTKSEHMTLRIEPMQSAVTSPTFSLQSFSKLVGTPWF